LAEAGRSRLGEPGMRSGVLHHGGGVLRLLGRAVCRTH
jgi:hypothetical protein